VGLRPNRSGDVEDVGADRMQHGRGQARDSRSGPSVFSSAFLSKYAAKFRQTCLLPCSRLRRHAYRRLNSDLYLSLNLSLPGWLFQQLFEALFQLSFASPFGSVFVSKNPPLRASPYLALRQQRLPRGRPVGRPLPGRIVAAALGHTTRCSLYKGPDTHVRMIRVLIKRVLSFLCISS
jgi:hypothetical protein